MNEELTKRLYDKFPLLYGDKDGQMTTTAMCWNFECGDGWFDIIWDLSSKLEPLIQDFIDEYPNAPCGGCGCKKEKHYGCKTPKPGKCLSIKVDPYSEEEPPNNYYACFCEGYRSPHPRASQVKEKMADLRFYLTCGTDEMYDLIDEASELSAKTCELCGKPGKVNEEGYWLSTRCDSCRSKEK